MKIGIGQDSHAFEKESGKKKCVVGGVVFEDAPGLSADSDGDVALHAICNAISSITHIPILGEIAPKMCKEGITNSSAYVQKALDTLQSQKITHVALTIEGKRPRFQARAKEIRENIASILNIEPEKVGITFTSGDGLTAFAKGEGLQCFCILSVQ